jgi:hypothetical protein
MILITNFYFDYYEHSELMFYGSNIIRGFSSKYLELFNNQDRNKEIPQAPSKYTVIIPTEGLKLELDKNENYSNINYQVFLNIITKVETEKEVVN